MFPVLLGRMGVERKDVSHLIFVMKIIELDVKSHQDVGCNTTSQ
jgi:hypothetical protein